MAGMECVHASELGFSRAEDGAIVELARERGAAIVTLDADFHAILARTKASGPSIVRLRLQGLNGEQVADLVLGLLRRFAEEIGRGALITVKARKTTCHRLPVAGPE
jgi:predicted nuclease of predicted toxin-antitoxin system